MLWIETIMRLAFSHYAVVTVRAETWWTTVAIVEAIQSVSYKKPFLNHPAT